MHAAVPGVPVAELPPVIPTALQIVVVPCLNVTLPVGTVSFGVPPPPGGATLTVKVKGWFTAPEVGEDGRNEIVAADTATLTGIGVATALL